MIYFYIESALALAVSLVINIFVLSVFAKGFYGKEEGDIGLENAGQFLGKAFGPQMKYIWAVGLLAAGKSCLILCLKQKPTEGYYAFTQKWLCTLL